MAEIEILTDEERSLLDQAYDEGYRPVAKALRIIDQLTALTTPPDFGVEHKLLTDWINSLPEPCRSFVCALETNADPSGNIRDAVCQRENAAALAARVAELEAGLNDTELRQQELEEDMRAMRTELDQVERAGAKSTAPMVHFLRKAEVAESEVARLREALGKARAANGIAVHEHRLALGSERKQRKSAEARARELDAVRAEALSALGETEEELAAVESEVARLTEALAAARALLKRALDKDPLARRDIRAHLAAQPAVAPTRTAAEQRVLDACRDAVLIEEQRGATVRLLSDGSSELVARAVIAWREAK